MICFIPTKGRPNTMTYKIFEEAKIKVLHFIEPQEIEKYQVPNKVSILENNKGIGYVRNFMLSYVKENGYEWVIFCDDDVQSFYIYKDKKNIKISAGDLLEYIKGALSLPFELIGFNYKQYIWVAKERYSVNTKSVEQCILVNTKKVKWSYRPEFNLKEDRDFVLQTIKNGFGVLRFNFIGVSSPIIGTNKGGLNELYKQKKDHESAIKMVKEWHPFVSLQKKGNRIDIKMDIKCLALSYKKQVK